MTPTTPRPTIPLEAFAQVQDQAGDVDILVEADGRAQVIASGSTKSGLKVEWVKPGTGDPVERAVVGRFLEAVAAEYGSRITATVARELGLEAGPGGGLPTHAVKAALQMAETQREVFSGANFFVELHCSAQARTPAFRAACQASNLDPGALTPEELADIDQRFRATAARTSQDNRAPLSPADGERLLPGVLGEWLGARPPRRN
jgi:hypothetical protein